MFGRRNGRLGSASVLVLVLVLVLVVTVSTTSPGAASAGRQADGLSAQHQPPDSSEAVIDWFDQTNAAVTGASLPTQVTNSRIWATSWRAALRALDGAHHYDGQQRRTFEAAAVATAVHDTLVGWLPGQADPLDQALAASLAAIPDSRAARAGRRAGATEAAVILAERAGDGLDVADVNVPFAPPPEAPGVWRLTPGATQAVQAGQGQGRTFVLGPGDRFRPPAPPALGSVEYRAGLAEVQRLGSATSTERTAAQTNVGLVWAQSSLSGYTSVLRALVADGHRSAAWKVRLLATFHTVSVDAQIAIYEAKYHFLHWRPVTAIRFADTDRDPLTDADPTWTPLITTPAHPEYPSGHAGYAGAAQVVLDDLVGPRSPVPFTLTRTLPSGETLTHPYRAGVPWAQLTQDNVDARVWTGIHFRFSDEVGATLGRRVARYDLAHADRLDA